MRGNRLQQLVVGQPPAAYWQVLAALVAGVAASAHIPALTAVAIGLTGLLVVLAGLWVPGRTRYAWLVAVALGSAPLTLVVASWVSFLVALLLLLLAGALVGRLVDVVLTSQQTLVRQHHERDELAKQASAHREEMTLQRQYWSTHDSLTTTLTRSSVHALLEELSAARVPAGVFVLSLAGFTAVNDALGGDIGDALLTALGKRLHSRARETDRIGRLGGDEFVVVLPGLQAEHAEQIVARLLGVLQEPFAVGTHVVALRARCGLAVDDGSFPDGPAELLKQARDAAGDAVVGGAANIATAANQSERRRALELEVDMHRALAAQEFFLLYQPLVSTATGRISSVEALVRWQHPQHGMVPPDSFIPGAERTGFIVPLGLRVLELACKQLRAWASGPAQDITVAVNVSARQLTEPDFVEQVRSVLWGSGVNPAGIVLELTESLLVENSQAAIDVLWALRGLGVKLAIDDFGTGYSSLARLGELPIDEMKIDKSFIDRLGAKPHDSTTLVTAAIAMGHGLGLTVVAEGIESAAQAAQLKDLGCDLLQGYLLGKPMTADLLTPQLSTRLLHEVPALPQPRSEADQGVYVPAVMPSSLSRATRPA